MRLFISTILVVLGAVLLLGNFSYLSALTYPIIWWGIILIFDEINLYRWKRSLICNEFKNFLLIIVPISTLFWVYYEFMNLLYIQWVYEGIIYDILSKVLLSFLSFGTVIPIIMEILWFFSGPAASFPVSNSSLCFIAKHKFFFMLLGFLFMAPPFFSEIFLLNNFMWAGPFFILLPFTVSRTRGDPEGRHSKNFWSWLVLAGLISGLLWEFLNFWAGGKWHYIILSSMFHIFEMPILGYVGFIPFAFSAVAVYFFAKKFLIPRLSTGLILYSVTAFATYYLLVIYSNL